jgi:hypothetical protein
MKTKNGQNGINDVVGMNRKIGRTRNNKVAKTERKIVGEIRCLAKMKFYV